MKTKVILLLCVTVCLFSTLKAQDGILDIGFNTTGKVITPIAPSEYSKAVFERNGKVVLVGHSTVDVNDFPSSDIIVQKYISATGLIDASFGTNGSIIIDLGTKNDRANAVTIQADDKIVITGAFGSDVLTMRLNTDGSFDNSFGTNGMLITNVTAGEDEGFGITIQNDNKIVVCGTSGINPNKNFLAIRLNADGSYDNTFAVNGVKDLDIGLSSYDEAYSVVLDNNLGRIYIGGHTNRQFSPTVFTSDNCLVALSQTDGALDNSFDGDGKFSFNCSASARVDLVYSICLQPNDGKIIMVGNSKSTVAGSVDWFSVARVLPAGGLDVTFNAGGVLLEKMSSAVAPSTSRDFAFGAFSYFDAGTNEHKVIAAGYSAYSAIGQNRFSVLCLNDNGTFNNSFGTNGKFFPDLGSPDAYLQGGYMQTNGKILLTGLCYNNPTSNESGYDFGVMRMNVNGTFDNTFSTDGKEVNFIRNQDKAFATVVDNADRTLLAGYNQVDFCIARHRSTGVLEGNTFGWFGVKYIDFGSPNEKAYAITCSPTDQYFVAGESGGNLAIAKMLTTGKLDLTFSGDGLITYDLGTNTDKVVALSLQHDGKLLVGATDGTSTFIMRYTSAGVLDVSFDGDGIANVNIGATAILLTSIALQPDGKILLTGNGGNDWVIARLNTDGTLDITFNTTGFLQMDMGSMVENTVSIAHSPTNKIVVVGNSANKPAVLNLNVDGSLNTNFNTTGKKIIDFGFADDKISSMAIEPDGKIVIAGKSNGSFAAARLSICGALDPTFNNSTGIARYNLSTTTNDEEATSISLAPNGKLVAGGFVLHPIQGYNYAAIRLNNTAKTFPVINFNGSASICEGTSTNIAVSFATGTSWTYTYTNGTTNFTSATNTTSPISLPVSPIVNTTYTLQSISSGGCIYTDAFVTSSAVIDVAALSKRYWLGGTNTDWNTASNWNCNTVPTNATDVFIQTGASFYPIIEDNQIGNCKNITLQTGASLIVRGTGQLNVFGIVFNSSGIFDVKDGTVNFDGTNPAQILSGLALKDNSIKNLIVSNALAIDTDATKYIKITGSLSFKGNNKTLTTNGNLTLVSNLLGTASVNDLTNKGLNTGNTINGKVSVERYLFAQKSWRFLATPVVKGTSPTITQAWREAGSSTSTGYGTQITGPSSYIGMDQTSQRGSLKYYNASNDSWTEVNNTSNRMADSLGYMVFVRGDRAVTQYGLGETNLRIKGDLLMGNQTFAVPAGKFQSFGNPFASRIDFRTVLKTNVSNAFITWNPKNVGLYNVGGYENYVLKSDGNYWLNGLVSGTMKNFIESGEAVFIQSNGSAGNITVREVDKALLSSNASRGTNQLKNMITIPTLDISLYTKPMQDSTVLLDGVSLDFAQNFNAEIDNDDVRKITNTINSLSIKSNNKLLVAERRPTLVATDTIQLNLAGTAVAKYEFEIYPTLMGASNVEAFLKDNFLQTVTPVSLNEITYVPFEISPIVESKGVDRFMIVFKEPPLASFTTIAAKRNVDKTITVDWGVAHEKNISRYTIEKSNDGINFATLTTQIPLANNGTNLSYTKLETTASKAANWYRIKATNTNTTTKYSNIAMVAAIKEDNTAAVSSISIYPNIITNKKVNFHFDNKKTGKYTIEIYNIAGQKIISKLVYIENSNTNSTIEIASQLSGKYEAVVTDEMGVKNTLSFIVQ